METTEKIEHTEAYSIDKIKGYKANPRNHPKNQIRQIAASMDKFGFTNPILIDEKSEILAGHGRLLAAKELNLKTVPVIQISHLSNSQKRAYRIADNKLTENGKWNTDLLKLEFQELESLDDLNFDLEITGFSTTEIDLYLDNDISQADEELNEIPELIQNPITKEGDIWIFDKDDNDHRIICGDSTQKETYEKLFDKKKASIIFTDPPYNVPIDKHVCGLGETKHREFAMASGEMNQEEFEEFLAKFIEASSAKLKDGGLSYICMDWRHGLELMTVATKYYSELKNRCVWNKINAGMGSFYRSKHEDVYVYKKGKKPHINNIELGKNGRYRTNVWDYEGVNGFGSHREDLQLHPTVKPVEMIQDAILDSTKRKEIVLDCFLGSGSTLIAAENSGRICYGVEIDPIYVDTCIERFQKLTSKEVYLQGTNKTYKEIQGERNV